MGYSSKKCARNVSTVASLLYFFIIILQVPLFSFPCRIGTCETPIEVLTCTLIVTQALPESVVKMLLYPGAIKRFVMEGAPIPTLDQPLNSFKDDMILHPVTTDIKHLEVVAGSFLCVAGAFLSLCEAGAFLGLRRRIRMSFLMRMSLLGLLLIQWGIFVKVVFGPNYRGRYVYIYPELLITTVVAFLCVRSDVRRLIRCCKSH